MPRLVLIDGSSYLYAPSTRCRRSPAPDGSPTGALFGIVNMLRATMKENPEYAAFVVDASGPTFRDEMYPEYKATRAAMPDESARAGRADAADRAGARLPDAARVRAWRPTT
jgi:DNA polymerase-1